MKNNIAYIGVDPGKTGFITICFNGEYRFYAMPYHKVDGKQVFHEEGFLDMFVEIGARYRKPYGENNLKVCIEEVGGRGGWSATNNFNFGYVAGMLKMMFILLGAEITMVRPQKWQSFMRQGYPDLKKSSSTGKTQVRDPKAVAELIVKTEFPEIDFRRTTRARKVDSNKVDSFLICQYLMRKDG